MRRAIAREVFLTLAVALLAILPLFIGTRIVESRLNALSERVTRIEDATVRLQADVSHFARRSNEVHNRLAQSIYLLSSASNHTESNSTHR